ncbi:hypothetical protein PRIPAC_76960 [Pristionchus pacificus]|uniref:G protein-coupled receptor n=1 Tax=Pristionchus pacificus TaxID=54126 RepID=A0A2A6C375_PRIPA|nr:hypothetical protein PRIPAC_76960 [Pristionchus pacificus]|eukprot:PDM72558.1 G protein-coupled receptor [Pristionchus pacificus]
MVIDSVLDIVCHFNISNAMFMLLVIGTSIEIPGSTEAKEMLAKDLNASSIDGWLIIRLDDDIALLSQITLIIFNVIMILGMSVSFTLASLTYLSIRRAAALSQNDRSMQMTLLIAVSAQVWD